MKPKYLSQVLILLLIILIFNSGMSFARGSFMNVINEKEKLWGIILLRHDSDPPCWKEADLPEGWRRIFNTHKFPEYIHLGQILPEKRDGKIFLKVSLFNLRQVLNKEGWPEKQIADTVKRLGNMPEIEIPDDDPFKQQ